MYGSFAIFGNAFVSLRPLRYITDQLVLRAFSLSHHLAPVAIALRALGE